jgi:hypothetical protein
MSRPRPADNVSHEHHPIRLRIRLDSTLTASSAAAVASSSSSVAATSAARANAFFFPLRPDMSYRDLVGDAAVKFLVNDREEQEVRRPMS